MVKRYQLRGHSGPVANRVIELIEPEITLGRDLSNDVVISDSEVSRSHARLSWRDDGYVIEDLRSTNGTWVNGHSVLRASRLTAGDMLTLGKVSVFVYELVPEPVTDTTPNQDASPLPDLIESTMLMPAWQKGTSKVGEVIRSRLTRPPAQPDEVLPVVDTAGEAQHGSPVEMELSSGRSFHQKYTACLQAGDLESLVSLYSADATLLSVDAGVTGTSGIAKFFEQYFGGVGSFIAVPTGKYVEGPDSILCETSVETPDTVALIHDAFVFREGKATHQFTSTVKSTSKLRKSAQKR